MSKIASLDRRSTLGRAQRRAKDAIVRELGGKVSPLQNILADATAFDIARLDVLNRTQDPDPKAVADLSARVSRGLHEISLSRDDANWLRSFKLSEPDADAESKVA